MILGIGALEELPQHIDRGFGLDGDAGEHAMVVDIADEIAGVRLALRGVLRVCGVGGEGGFVVEAV